MNKFIIAVLGTCITVGSLTAQTLQSVTNSGNSTTRSVWIGMDSAAGVTGGVVQNTLNVGGKMKLLGLASVYTSGPDANQPTIYRSGVNNGTYPFNNYDNLILQAGGATRDILFVTGLAPTEKMTIKGNGNVGIGTNNPIVPLHTVSYNNTNMAAAYQWGEYYGTTLGVSGTAAPYYALHVAANLNADGSGKTGGYKSLLFVGANGNTGMGITTPNYNLQIHGSNSSYVQFTSSVTGTANTDGFIVGSGMAGQAVLLNRDNTDMIFYTNNMPQMYLNAGGNLLVGKSSQTNSTYKLDVAGNVRADKVVVNTTGADFVFDSSYELPSLSEIEKFVTANKHLPGIASAAQMQQNGLDIGEHQTRLLQKTEELTLYLIAQYKYGKEQQQKLEAQDKKLISLENKLTEQAQLIEKLLQRSPQLSSNQKP
jgi:hypothetical protein